MPLLCSIDVNKVQECCAGGRPTLGVMLGHLGKHEHPLAPPKLVVGIRFPQHHPVSNPVIPTFLPLGQAMSGQEQGQPPKCLHHTWVRLGQDEFRFSTTDSFRNASTVIQNTFGQL